MKIAFIGGRDIHKLGGIENYMLNLATELVKMGHEPIVFCESDHDGEEIVNGFRVIHQKGFQNALICKPILGLKATWRVIRTMKDVDIIHYNAWPPSLWSPLANLFGFNSLMQGHGLEWQRSKYSGIEQKILKFMEWYTAKINKKLIMCSEDQCVYFKRHYHRDSECIPTAINLPVNSHSVTSDIFCRHGIKEGKYFLFLARIVQDKNPDYLIRAFNMRRPEGFQLVIAGDNPGDREYVEKLYAQAGDNRDIIFTGAVYGADKESLLRNAYAFCIPSTIEGLSIALLEAMSYRLPIIASDIPANREVLEKDKAIWVRPENENDLCEAYQRCVDEHDNLMDAVAYNYRKVRDNYTWDRVAHRYINYCQQI